jgi:molybdopterin-containing oxidoreductase family membrane subunit
VPSLAHSYEPWKFMNYHLTWVEASILMGSFGWFFMWFLLFLRYLPGLSIAEIKEVLPPPMRKQHATAHVEAPDQTPEPEPALLPTGYTEHEPR